MNWHRNPFVRYGALIAAAVTAVILIFPGTIHGLFRADQFMPHATCYLRNPKIILLHVSSDLLIGCSYVAISSTLAYLVYKASKDIPFHWMFLAFGLFIITCGFTHFMEVWTVWQAVYWLAGYVKLICAAASVATAIALVPLVPRVFALIASVRVSEERKLKLEVANSELEAFAYSVSHDLRAPLRAVEGMAVALKEDYGPALPKAGREYIQRIMAASERMDDLIHDLLEYSRVSRADADLSPVEVRDALNEARETLSEEITRTGAQLEIAPEFPRVIANKLLLTQIATNLIANGLKFVAPGTAPRVAVYSRSDGQVRLVFQDNGIGIAAEHQQRIFQMFERLHPASEYPGTGLGLAIVQKAVSRMNGRLGLESEPGKGSCFWVELPRA
jgi:signal transduction histidine kinase